MERVQLYMEILNPTKSNFTPCFRLCRFRLQGEAFAIGWCFLYTICSSAECSHLKLEIVKRLDICRL
jgi:hypothetical protein